MKAFLDLLRPLASIASNIVEEHSESSFEPPQLPEFESAKCTSAEYDFFFTCMKSVLTRARSSLEAMLAYSQHVEEDDTTGAFALTSGLQSRIPALQNRK